VTTYEVEFLVPRAGHACGDRALMTCGAAERLAQRGVVRIVQTILPDVPSQAQRPVEVTPSPKRRGRPPKVK
jgi:hypothetical protein